MPKGKWEAIQVEGGTFEVKRQIRANGNKYETLCDCYATQGRDAMENAELIAKLMNEYDITPKCKGCGSDLGDTNAVKRQYINKDDEDGSAYALGHYENDEFESDSKPDLSGGRFDLCDGSDTCMNCGEVVG